MKVNNNNTTRPVTMQDLGDLSVTIIKAIDEHCVTKNDLAKSTAMILRQTKRNLDEATASILKSRKEDLDKATASILKSRRKDLSKMLREIKVMRKDMGTVITQVNKNSAQLEASNLRASIH